MLPEAELRLHTATGGAVRGLEEAGRGDRG